MPLAVCVLAASASTPQSALSPAGTGALQIASLFWWMLGGACVVWLAVIGLAVYATQLDPERHSPRLSRWLILGGGVLVPVVVLGVLLSFGLRLMPELRAAATSATSIAVSGEQWWWRVRYLLPSGEWVELANEIRLPRGERVGLRLDSPDVIHSFWIPALGGKVDMIPGRTTTLVLEPTRSGVYRGVCAEYCGTSHALMKFAVEVMEPAAFDDWLQRQAAPARTPTAALAMRGADAFLHHGCGACHSVRGTPADGTLGPDLTHVGSRHTLAAGILPNDAAAFARFVAHAGALKPDARMPAFDMLPADDLEAIAAYLAALE